MILIDSNVPMYLVGAPHPHKLRAQKLLERFLRDRERLVTDAEVLQEVLHRCITVHRPEAIQPAFDVTMAIVDEVLPIEGKTVERAKEIVLAYRRLSARDAIHLAVMERHRIDQILTFDSGFDSLPGITRFH